MRPGRRSRLASGCLWSVVLCIACSLGLFAAATIWPEVLARLKPLDTGGGCSREDVESFFEPHRLDGFLAALRSVDSADGAEAIDPRAVDLGALQRERDKLAARDVPECLTAVRNEEVALADGVISAVRQAQAPGPTWVRGLIGLWRLFGIGVHIRRIDDAEKRLRSVFGLNGETDGPPYG